MPAAVDLDAIRENYEGNQRRLEAGTEPAVVIARVDATITEDVGTACTFELYGRPFTLIVDEGRHRGGHERGPTPLRYFLTGIASCQLEWFVKGAAVSSRKLDDLQLDVHTMLDPRGEHGWESAPVHPQWLVLDARVDSPDSPTDVLAFMDWGNGRCPLTELVRRSVPVYLRVALNGVTLRDEVPPEVDARLRDTRRA